MALSYQKFEKPKTEFNYSHNLYNIIGSALGHAYESGKLTGEDVNYYLNDVLQVGADFKFGDYGISAQYNAPDPLDSGFYDDYSQTSLGAGKLDYKVGVSFPFNIKGL